MPVLDIDDWDKQDEVQKGISCQKVLAPMHFPKENKSDLRAEYLITAASGYFINLMKRDEKLYEYGVDAPLLGYSYFYTKLKNWLINKINTQKNFSVLEDIAKHLKNCNYPKRALISIGATAYASFGEKNYLKKEDEIYVIAYDKSKDNNSLEKTKSKIILHQEVV